MGYAVPSNRPLVTDKPLVRKHTRSAFSEYVDEWCRTHTISLSLDKETGAAVVSVHEIQAE